MYKSRTLKFHIFIIFSFLLIALLSNILLMHQHILFDASDMQFHFKRINELLTNFYHCKPLSSFAFNQFNGSSVMYFYPYLNLLPFIILVHFTRSKIILMYLFFIINTLISLLVCFYSSYSVSKSYATSYAFSVIYSTSSIIFGYEYIFMDLGVVSAMSFLPLPIFGFIDLLYNRPNYIKLSVGITLVAFCHILSFIVLISFLLIWILINYKIWTKSLIINLIKSFSLCVLLTSFIWMPIIYILYTNKIHSPFLLRLSGVPNKTFITSVLDLPDPIGIGLFPLLTIVISIFFWKRFSHLDKQMYIISIIYIYICSKFFPWGIIPNKIAILLSHFQSTYRFLIIPIVLLNFIFALIITQLISNNDLEKYISVALILIGAVGLRLYTQHYFIRTHINYPDFSLNNYNKGNSTSYSTNYKMSNSHQINKLINCRPNGMNSDYYPMHSINKLNYIDHNIAVINQHYSVRIHHVAYNTFIFKDNSNSNRITLPIMSYNKEKLNIYNNNHKVKYSVNKNNLIAINNIKKGTHKLYVENNSNWILTFLDLIMSIVGLFWILFIYL